MSSPRPLQRPLTAPNSEPQDPPAPRRFPLASESGTKTPKGGLQAGAAGASAVEPGASCSSPSCCRVPEAAELWPNWHHGHARPYSAHGDLLAHHASSARPAAVFWRLPPAGQRACSRRLLSGAGDRPRSASPPRAPQPPPGQLPAQRRALGWAGGPKRAQRPLAAEARRAKRGRPVPRRCLQSR